MVNRVTIIGRVGRDAEAQFVGDGNAIAHFNVATIERWVGKGKEVKERTDWHRITAWGKLAEIAQKNAKTGVLVFVEAKLQYRQYQKEGQTIYATDVVADTLRFLASPPAAANTSPPAIQGAPGNRGGSTAGAALDPSKDPALAGSVPGPGREPQQLAHNFEEWPG